jgi:hypothetical protein
VLSSEHVLVIEWLDGVNLRAAGQGTLTLLTPEVDIAAEARFHAANYVAGQLSPKAIQKTATDEMAALLPVLRRLPRRFDRVTSAIEQGRLSLNVRLFADERDRRVVTGLTHQFLLTFLGTASGVVAALLLGTSGGPEPSVQRRQKPSRRSQRCSTRLVPDPDPDCSVAPPAGLTDQAARRMSVTDLVGAPG